MGSGRSLELEKNTIKIPTEKIKEKKKEFKIFLNLFLHSFKDSFQEVQNSLHCLGFVQHSMTASPTIEECG